MKYSLAVLVALVLGVGLAAKSGPQQSAQQQQQPRQQPADQQQRPPTFRTGVNFVRVDAYPTANGRIVSDLKQDEFEVLEDGVPQKIETFERVEIRTPGAEVERAEPTSIAASNQAAADPRNRLFVLFLDSYHTSRDTTSVGASAGVYGRENTRASGRDNSRIGHALATFLQQLIGADDLIALARPEMPMDTITFTRRPSSFEDFLFSGGEWQRRFEAVDLDDTERQYQQCYPEEPGVVGQMIARRRERMVIDALNSLVAHLQNLREERKAILVVSEGWQLFKPDSRLSVRRDGSIPGAQPIGVRGGQPTIGDPRDMTSRYGCDRDRGMLAELDNEREFRTMLDSANRANATFYPIDPRGLPVFDGLPGGSVIADATALRTRQDSLITLATATDGVASVNSNDFAKSFKRISDDLSSYYLLGYYSTNAKTDGKFRKITVRVKRPGVDVRARRGYNAATEAEMASRMRVEAPVDAETRTRDAALSTLGAARADRPTHLAAGYRWQAQTGDAVRPVVWVTAELDAAAARSAEWSGGADASVTLASAAGQPIATQTGKMTATARAIVLQFDQPGLKPGEYLVKLRAAGQPGSGADAGEQFRVTVPADQAAPAGALGQPWLYRRGPYTGPAYQATADARFRKAERLRVDVPLPGPGPADSVTARLLDRKGQPIVAIPVNAAQREDGALRFATAEVVVAPLAPADYLVEVSVARGPKTEKVLAAFRVIP
ncbi:MAG: VWA domain-containing protein [Bacteroidales bacterium]